MDIYKKYIEGKSYRELHEIRHSSIPGSDVYQQVVEEIHRIQQDTNNTQVANLINEIKVLKNITEKSAETSKRNAKSDSNLAHKAIFISVIAIIVQAIFSIHYTYECRHIYTDDSTKSIQYSGCYRKFDLAGMGTHVFEVDDFSTPIGQ
jgi:hypothetical protein